MLAEIARYDEAESQLRRVIADGERLGGGVIVSLAYENLGFLAVLRGDLPAALEHLSAAEDGLVTAETYLPRGWWVDHARALANAALFDDAEVLPEQALERFEEQGHGIEVATSRLTLAELRLAQGDSDAAAAAADEAAEAFHSQGRPGWESIAEALRLQAAARASDADAGLAPSLRRSPRPSPRRAGGARQHAAVLWPHDCSPPRVILWMPSCVQR